MDLDCALDTSERVKRIQKAVLQRTGQLVKDEDSFIYILLLIAEFAPHVAHAIIQNQHGMDIREMRTAIFRASGQEIPDTDPLFVELAVFEEGMRIVYEIIQKLECIEEIENAGSNDRNGGLRVSRPWWLKLYSSLRERFSRTS